MMSEKSQNYAELSYRKYVDKYIGFKRLDNVTREDIEKIQTKALEADEKCVIIIYLSFVHSQRKGFFNGNFQRLHHVQRSVQTASRNSNDIVPVACREPL